MPKPTRVNARPDRVQPRTPATESEAGSVSKPKSCVPELAGWRLWCFRLITMLLAPVLVLGVAEIGLRLAGYGFPTSFFVKTTGGSFVSNQQFCWQFYSPKIATHPHPLLLPPTKEPGTIRVFVLGESAAEGTPDPAYGFARILERILRDRYPNKKFEVINAAVRGINSHFIVPIARDCAGHEPDLFVFYMGNNEAIGLYSPEPNEFNLAEWPTLIEARQLARKTRVAELMVALADRSGPQSKPQDMEYFREQRVRADHPVRESVYKNFERNLNTLCEIAGKTPVVLSSVAVNLRDCPPLGSLHRDGLGTEELGKWQTAFTNGVKAQAQGRIEEALGFYKQASATDDHYAELRYRMGQCHLALKQLEAARQEFVAARDWDALQFRSDSRVNEVIRKVAEARGGQTLRFCDVAKALAVLDELGIPGRRQFIDQVHFSFDGDYAVACAMLPSIESALGLTAPASPVLSREECAARLALTMWDEFNILESIGRATSVAPYLDQVDHERRAQEARQAATNKFEAAQRGNIEEMISVYRKAVIREPKDWLLRLHFGEFYADMKEHRAAAGEFKELASLFPYFAPFRLKYAQALAETGRQEEAVEEIYAAGKLDPYYPAVKEAMDWAKTVTVARK